jgi:hypothetical protein
MTYQPHNPGYPGPQPPAGYGAAPVRPPVVREGGPSKLPVYLTGAVLLLGLFAYLASFGPLFNINTNIGPFGGAELTASGMGYWTIAALIAALLAGAGLVARGRNYAPVVAVTAVLGLLLVVGQLINRPSGVSVGWALWLVLLLTLLQAGAAVVALLMEAGVITPPAVRVMTPTVRTARPPAATTDNPVPRRRRVPPRRPATRGSTRAVAMWAAATDSRTTVPKPLPRASQASDSSSRLPSRRRRSHPGPPAPPRPERYSPEP